LRTRCYIESADDQDMVAGEVEPMKVDEGALAKMIAMPVKIGGGTSAALAHEWSKASSFQCALRHDADGIGLTCDVWPAFLQVTTVSGGSAGSYNSSVAENERISRNDAILAVNGCTEPEAMMRMLESEVQITLQVVRPSRLMVKVSRDACTFGLQLAIHTATSTCIWIDRIEEGAVQSYNFRVAANLQIRPQDLIESVNGVAGMVSKMVEEMRSSSKVELVVLRVPDASEC